MNSEQIVERTIPLTQNCDRQPGPIECPNPVPIADTLSLVLIGAAMVGVALRWFRPRR